MQLAAFQGISNQSPGAHGLGIGRLKSGVADEMSIKSPTAVKPRRFTDANIEALREFEMRGTFRFHEEFGLAVDLINQRKVDMKPLLTGVFGLDEATAAFEIAGDRNRSMKVQLSF